MKKLSFFVVSTVFCAALFFCGGGLGRAQAQDPGVTIVVPALDAVDSAEGEGKVQAKRARTPYAAQNNTHDDLKLTPDRSEIIKLPTNVSTVLVGNPVHLSVLAESPRVLVLVGKAPGATYFTALDANDNIIMQRPVIVAAPQEGYVRVRRSCVRAEDPAACQGTSVYYCPDMCHEVAVPSMEDSAESETVGADSGMTDDQE